MATELFLPPTFPYPIKVVSLDLSSHSTVNRGTRLLTYSFLHIPTGTSRARPESRFGTWDSAVEGIVDRWMIKPGDIISEHQARDSAAILVTEPCKHGVQIGGLCGLCGKDMTECARFQSTYATLTYCPTVTITQASQTPLAHPSK